MDHVPSLRGDFEQCEQPEWGPLLDKIGEEAVADYMWMHEITLADDTTVHAYEHRNKRRYVHLGTDDREFFYNSEGRYVELSRHGYLSSGDE